MLEKDNRKLYKYKNIFAINAGKLSMKISASGGRIISFRFGNTEIITNSDEHANFGSTLWPAPQSDWGWPPYPVLDNEAYTAEKIGDTLKMISKPDIKSGLQFEKRFFPIRNKFIRIEYLVRNISEKQKIVAAWEVTRVPCGGLVFFPDGGKASIPVSTLIPHLSKDSINWVVINKEILSEHKKLFAAAREGWMAYAFRGVLFIKQFPDTAPQDYSPDQGEVEVYINKDKRYAELENHGSYTSLQPGQSLRYITNWVAVPLLKTIPIYNEHSQLSFFARSQANLIKLE